MTTACDGDGRAASCLRLAPATCLSKPGTMQPPIKDYAVIGDCRAAALVSRAGSIDWLCWPRFDSPSIFAAILDERAGRWTIAPRGLVRSERRYIDGTNVLETRLETATGAIRLTDLMPVASEEEKR